MSLGGLLRAAAAPALFALLLPACSNTEWWIPAQKSVEWAYQAESQASVFALLYDVATLDPSGTGSLKVTSSDDYATSVAVDLEARFGSCLTTTTTGAKNTYAFASCGGAYGIGYFDGEVDATYHLDDINGDTIGVDFSIESFASRSGPVRVALAGGNAFPAATWSSVPENRLAFHLAEISPPVDNTQNRDAVLALTGQLTHPDCLSPVGKENDPAAITSAHGFISVDDAEAWTIDVKGFHRCGDGCPAAGGTIEVELGQKLLVLFDGTHAAHVSNLTTGEEVFVEAGCLP